MTNEPAPENPAPAPQPIKAVELPPTAPLPKPQGSPVGRFFRHIFSPNTRTGKIVRPVVRGLAAVVGFFALGLLAGYTLLYQPVEEKYRQAQSQLDTAELELEQKQGDLQEAALTFIGADAERKQAVAERDQLEGRLAVWQAISQVADVRLALARKDSAAAKLALSELETKLTAALPVWENLKAADQNAFKRLLELAKGDLARDAALADQDLERLVSELMLVEQTLTK